MTNLSPYDGPGRHSGRHQPRQIIDVSEAPGTEFAAAVQLSDSALARVRALQEKAWSDNTKLNFRSHWKAFEAWCSANGYQALPAEPLVVASYLASMANLVDDNGDWFYAVGTLGQWLSSINMAHAVAGFPKPGEHPEVDTTMAGIRREHARPEARKAPLLLADLRRVLADIDLNTWPAGVIGHRDYAILIFGFAGAYRRSEIASIQLRDVKLHPEDGLHVLVRKSKTDQEGRGVVKGLPFGSKPATCAPCAFVRWVRVLAARTAASHETDRAQAIRVLRESTTDRHVCRGPVPELELLDGRLPLFRPVMKNGAVKPREISGEVVNAVVQRRVAATGMNSVIFGAHSLRAGFVTQSFRAGASHHDIMRQTGHKTITTLEIYSRENDPLRHNSVMQIGL
jgi:integrase